MSSGPAATAGIDSDHVAQSAAPPFAERAVQILNDGCLAMLISIGYQTRLFDLMAELPPSTSEQIAQRSGLNERYVREWLGGMVVGQIVRYDASARTEAGFEKVEVRQLDGDILHSFFFARMS